MVTGNKLLNLLKRKLIRVVNHKQHYNSRWLLPQCDTSTFNSQMFFIQLSHHFVSLLYRNFLTCLQSSFISDDGHNNIMIKLPVIIQQTIIYLKTIMRSLIQTYETVNLFITFLV